MKKFVIIISLVIALLLALDLAYFRMGWFVDLQPQKAVTTLTKAEGNQLWLRGKGGYESFEIKGVNLGSGKPGEWATDFAIDKETYLRWFRQMQEMGANTVRIYTVQQDTFYNAFYEYNKDNDHPLWLIHGVWVNDYMQNSHRDAYDPDFYDTFLDNCRTMVDVIHGAKKISMGKMASAGSGSYRKDISPWVIGYILGVEWEDVTVAYTDETYRADPSRNSYHGSYLYTSDNATPFESMLASVGDKVIAYETEKYKEQRMLAFSNWPTTDPFSYPETVSSFFMKCAKVDVEHIQSTDRFLAGQFASYHVYPYYPDYLSYVKDWSVFGLPAQAAFYTEDGTLNTYQAYLSLLTQHHTMPVVISEFGVSTGRGMAQKDLHTNRNQGNMSETQQGQALIDCYNDIRTAGCAGCCIFSWQDEWFKRTWNTMYAVNLKRTPYWSDYQTNEQYFGLLSFDPGAEQSVCYVDGDPSEWDTSQVVCRNEDMTLSMQYDEKFLYFLIQKGNWDFTSQPLYLPIDITPNSGSHFCENNGLSFDRDVDFLLTINGTENSRLTVQERYEALRSTYSENITGVNTYLSQNIPAKDSPKFVNIDMILQTATPLLTADPTALAEVYETGKLTYGNANPFCPGFDSLADFCVNGDYAEVKLPWQLLNVSDPSRMEIHDDYYDGNFGVKGIFIDRMYLGISDGTPDAVTPLSEVALRGWNNHVTYHERLKASYQMMQNVWKEQGNG